MESEITFSLFAMGGCLCRIFCDQLFGEFTGIENASQIINHSFMANVLACFILGALDGSPVGGSGMVALYEGLGAGFCGTFSTWSNWNQQLSLIMIEESETPAQSQIQALLSALVGFHVFFGSYVVGQDFAVTIIGKDGRSGKVIASISSTLIFIMTFACFTMVALLDVPEKERSIVFAVILSPFGACIRNLLSKFHIFNEKLPLGTLIVNVTGAVVTALVHVFVTRYAPYDCAEGDLCWPRIAIFGLEIGFCSSLTTLSAIMSEIYYIKKDTPYSAYLYFILTFVLSQASASVINGFGLSTIHYYEQDVAPVAPPEA